MSLETYWLVVPIVGLVILVPWTAYEMLRQRRERLERRIIETLRHHIELSSYDIRQEVDIGAGALYPTLMRMERNGTLVSRWGIATEERGGHRPRLYRLRDN